MTESIWGANWRSARGWEDVQQALEERWLVCDKDGDQVVAVNPDSGIYTYTTGNETETHRTSDVTTLRIKEAVATQDLQETLASLRGGVVEWGVRDNATVAGDVTDGFVDRADCEDWIRRNPLNFGPGDFDVVTRIVTPWEKA